MGQTPRKGFGTALLIALCLWASAAVEAAMPERVPLSVEMRTGLRAVAAMEPDEKIRNPDTMARHFLSPAFWHYGPLSPDFQKAKQFIQAYRVGHYYSVNACSRRIDEILADLAGRGLRQVVVVGAGFDTRAYRFADMMPEVRFFEIDYPVVIDHKKKTLETVLGKVPEGTVYLPFDIRKNSVEGALKQAGYRKEETTLFFWEDATAYSEPAAMDASLRFIADNAAAGSEIAFTYIPEKLVKGDYSKYRRAVFQAVRTASAGEPWRFGIPEGGAEAFLDRRGLRLVADIGAEEMVRQYLIQSDGTPAGKPTPYLRLLRAAVPE